MVTDNIKFLEKYKELDQFLKDKFNSETGVTNYLKLIEKKKLKNDYYYNLKHLRWLRNQLTHEPKTMNSNFVTIKDLEYLDKIYDSIRNLNDPLSKRIISEKQTKPEKQNHYLFDLILNIIKLIILIVILILIFKEVYL